MTIVTHKDDVVEQAARLMYSRDICVEITEKINGRD